MLTKSEAIALLNQLGKEEIPFSFYCDFLGNQWSIKSERDSNHSYSFQLSIDQKPTINVSKAAFTKAPINLNTYKKSFDRVIEEINRGNSFLTNLTFETPIQTNLTLEEIFHAAQAKYRLMVHDQFVVFSPETFVKMENGFIHSYPMKGTIDADLPNARDLILADIKEKAEHVTIVDLIRNDLSQIATEVHVTKFRYIDEIKTNEKHLLQVSSEIQGKLPHDWKQQIGTILTALLPAGSISGAPKPETLRIIQENEQYERGFYTGICGQFDGKSLDSGVMIRFIKKENDQLFYCSGGGITSFSEVEKEYKEMVDKVYLPFLQA